MKFSEGSGTLVGRSITIRGEVTGSEDLYLDGAVEGTVKLTSGRLTIGANAQIAADVQAPDIIVLGRIDGNVHSDGRVELRDKASVVGDVVAVRLAVEDGAILSGHVDLRGPDEAAADEKSSSPSPETRPEPETPLFQH